jgi:poly-gamma-glutamate synthesis protein (capsule biosynthesis protein)
MTRDCFPYIHSGEPKLPRYLRVRAEGRSRRENFWSGLSYLRKYRTGKMSAPPEEVRYFDHQRELLCLLRSHEAPSPGQSVRLAMVGDLMWIRRDWDAFLSPEVLDHLNSFDAVLGNLETVISRRFKVPFILPDYFSYNSHPSLVTSFRRPGGGSTFSALATCNNHTLDRGDPGLVDTLDFLDEQGIRHSGVRRHKDERPYTILNVGGIRVGFHAACWGLNNPASTSQLHIEVLTGLAPTVRHPVDLGAIRRALADMTAEGVEFKVVSMHWGYEFEFYPCPDLMQVGREIIRAGADVIMGTHPHVVQPLEICLVNGYEQRHQAAGLSALERTSGCLIEDHTGMPRKGLIAYSLGNFTTAMYSAQYEIGLVLGLTLQRDAATGRIDWHLPDMRFVYNTRSHPAEQGRRLVMLDTYLRKHALRNKQLRATAEFVHAHMLGQE